MKYDKKLSFLFAYWTAMLLLLLGLAPLCFGNKAGGESEKENRTLQAAPRFTLSAWFSGSFSGELESYLSDQMPFRNEILDASAACMNVFDARSAEEKILHASVGEALEKAGEMKDGDELDGEPFEEPEAFEEPEPLEEAPEVVIEAKTESTPEPVAAPEATPAPAQAEAPAAPAATPVDPAVKDTKTTRAFYYKRTDGGTSSVFHYEQSAIEGVIKSLTAYRGALKEDGNVYFTYVPDSQRADKWLFNTKTYCGWHSDVEDTIQANVPEGVHVFSSVNELERYMQAGEPVYFKTDHHWSGLGAYTMASVMTESRGVPAVAYRDFTFTVHEKFTGSIYQSALDMAGTKVYDTLEVPAALAPTVAAEYKRFDKLIRTVRYMEPERSSYSAFLGGTHDPFFVVDTGFHTGRNAVVICDSFGNAFIPFIAPYYDKVCQIDLREEHTFITQAGGSVSDYIKFWNIDDVYFVVSNGNGVNSSYMRSVVRKYL